MAVTVPLDDRTYQVHFRSLSHLPALMSEAGLEPRQCLLITDHNVARHYQDPVEKHLQEAGWTVQSVVLPAGEATKSAPNLHTIYDDALEWGIDRSTPVVALGGGVVGDLAGFAAATLLRGLPLVQVPTSLLAQVDASVGGKTAINHSTGKNLIGAFYQPRLVCADPATLETLPHHEYTSGLAEVVKHALIDDPGLFASLEDHLDDVLSFGNRETVAAIIEQAVQVKANVVSADEREEGRRAILNFGHTFGHALERVAVYGTFAHGEAVALGMRAGLFLSHRRHPDAVALERLDAVVRAIPVEHDPSAVAFDEIYDSMSVDKKNRGDTIRYVLLNRLGQAYIASDVSRDEAREAWSFACSS